MRMKRSIILLVAIAALLLGAGVASAQQDSPKKRLRAPAVTRGFIGGESHDAYVIKARKGRTMTVQISWRRAGDNRAEFTVSESPSFFSADPATFGTESDNGRRWTGKIPKTGDYHIYVVAHPDARYTLRVTVK